MRAARAIQILLLLQCSTRDDEYNLELMRLLDEQYTKVPFYGVRRRTAWLRALGEPEAGQGADVADGTSGYLSP